MTFHAVPKCVSVTPRPEQLSSAVVGGGGVQLKMEWPYTNLQLVSLHNNIIIRIISSSQIYNKGNHDWKDGDHYEEMRHEKGINITRIY